MMGIEVTSTVAYVPTAPVRVVDSVGKVPSEFELYMTSEREICAGMPGCVKSASPVRPRSTSTMSDVLASETLRFDRSIVLPAVAHSGVSSEKLTEMVDGGAQWASPG